jgi:hypothetical protein
MILSWGATFLDAVGRVIGGPHGADVQEFAEELVRLEKAPVQRPATSR